MYVIGLTLLFAFAFSFSIPAPENLLIQSVNFNHTLSWNPGNGTPPGTLYQVFDLRSNTLLASSKMPSVKLVVPFQRDPYTLVVVAIYNNSRSADSPRLLFLPYQTTIGPPQVLLSPCDKCLNVLVVLPEADSSSGDNIHDFYLPDYVVDIKKRGEQVHRRLFTTNKVNFTVSHLHAGTEYCLRVGVNTHLNPNTHSSAWTCAFTSRVEPSTGPVVIPSVVVILIAGALMAVFCLRSMGFICKKTTLPVVLLMEPRQGFILALDRIAPDPIHISPAAQPAAEEQEEEEDEDEDEDEEDYVMRNSELSSGKSLCRNSAEGHPAGEPEWEEEEDEGEEVGQTEVQEDVAEGVEGSREEEEEEEQDFDCSGEINLLSVRLRALDDVEEEEQTSDWTEEQALLSCDHARTPVEDQSVPQEEEEDEDALSGYLRHS